MSGQRWTVRDRYGNDVYLTEERWRHIVEPANHPEMAGYEAHLYEVVRLGRRKQDPTDPRKYRYIKEFDDLIDGGTHVLVIVICGSTSDDARSSEPNNFIVTAFLISEW